MSRQDKPNVKGHAKKILRNPTLLVSEYPLLLLAIVGGLVAARFLLPHFPHLGDWSKKYSQAVIDIGRQEVPTEAQHLSSAQEIQTFFQGTVQFPLESLRFNGPVISDVWKCRPLGLDSACLRLIYKNENLTLAVTTKPPKLKRPKVPFLKQGWGGAFLLKDGLAWTLVGPLSPDELFESWPYSN